MAAASVGKREDASVGPPRERAERALLDFEEESLGSAEDRDLIQRLARAARADDEHIADGRGPHEALVGDERRRDTQADQPRGCGTAVRRAVERVGAGNGRVAEDEPAARGLQPRQLDVLVREVGEPRRPGGRGGGGGPDVGHATYGLDPRHGRRVGERDERVAVGEGEEGVGALNGSVGRVHGGGKLEYLR